MTLKSQISGSVVKLALGQERSVRRTLSRRKGIDVALQVEDAHGFLLVQLLGDLLREMPDEEVRVLVIPPPEADTDPEPELRLSWNLKDAHLVAQHRGLEGPSITAPPPAEVIEKAQRILLVDRPGKAQIDLACEVLRRVWNDDREGLEQLARQYGELPTSELRGQLSSNWEQLKRLGHYQGSMVRHRGEWFWGTDRFEMLERSLGQDRSRVGWSENFEVPPIVGEDGRVRLEFYYSFRSPYSYLVLKPLRRMLRRRSKVDLVIRPVLPMVMRGLPVPLSKRLYILADCHRLAVELGTPFGKAFDPKGEGVERCLAIFVAADAQGLGDVWLEEAATAIWTEARNMTRDEELRPVVERAGLSWERAQQAMADEASWRQMATDNRTALFDAGLWGVPSLVVGGYAMWGQDRIPILTRILDAAGV